MNHEFQYQDTDRAQYAAAFTINLQQYAAILDELLVNLATLRDRMRDHQQELGKFAVLALPAVNAGAPPS